MKKTPKLLIALGGVVLGILLLFWGNSSRAAGNDGGTQHAANGTGAPNVTPTAEAEALSADAYREALETRMAALCGRVSGAGEVSVAVHLAGGFEYVYACDEKASANGVSTSYITVGSGSGEAPVYITVRAPTIAGIGVVCSGGADATVRREITALLSAAFGVSSNKIYVTAGK